MLILLGLLWVEFLTGRAIHQPNRQNGVKIKMVGHQWWWEIHYEDPEPFEQFMITGTASSGWQARGIRARLRRCDS